MKARFEPETYDKECYNHISQQFPLLGGKCIQLKILALCLCRLSSVAFSSNWHENPYGPVAYTLVSSIEKINAELLSK